MPPIMKENKIIFLAVDKIRIAKQIILVSQFKNKELSIGYFLYERKLSDNYKMLEVPEEEKDFTYRLEYPQERLFPVDDIDNLIMQSVRALFPKSRTKNWLVVTTLDEGNLKRLTDRQFEKGELIFHPSFANVNFYQMVGKEFTQLSASIKIYNDFKKDEIKDLTFVAYFDVRNQDVLNRIREIKFH